MFNNNINSLHSLLFVLKHHREADNVDKGLLNVNHELQVVDESQILWLHNLRAASIAASLTIRVRQGETALLGALSSLSSSSSTKGYPRTTREPSNASSTVSKERQRPRPAVPSTLFKETQRLMMSMQHQIIR